MIRKTWKVVTWKETNLRCMLRIRLQDPIRDVGVLSQMLKCTISSKPPIQKSSSCS